MKQTEDMIMIKIKASHFLWKMVRRIVGVLVEVGKGKMSSENIPKANKTEPLISG